MVSFSSSDEATRQFSPGIASQKAPSEPLKNFGLSCTDFEHLLNQLQAGSEELYEQVFLAHFGDCMTYLKRQCKASHNDAYDATMEAMLLFLERLKAGKVQYGNLRFLFTRMAQQIYFRWIKKLDAPLVYGQLDISEQPEAYEEWLPMLQLVWPRLPKRDRELLTAYYFRGISLKQLAIAAGTTAATLRKRKQRSLERLRVLVLKG